MNDPDGGDADFSVILIPDNCVTTGLVSNSGSNAVLNGFQTSLCDRT